MGGSATSQARLPADPARPARRARPGIGRLLAPLLGVALLACPGANTESHPTVEGPLPWGGTPNVYRYGSLTLAGQPDAAGLRAAHNAGVTAVVNLRAPSESSWDEAGAAETAGLAYYSVPVPGSEPLERDAMDRVDALVAEHEGNVLIHCASGNRAAAWLAVHLVREEGRPVEEALAVSRAAGLTRERIANQVRDHLGP